MRKNQITHSLKIYARGKSRGHDHLKRSLAHGQHGHGRPRSFLARAWPPPIFSCAGMVVAARLRASFGAGMVALHPFPAQTWAPDSPSHCFRRRRGRYGLPSRPFRRGRGRPHPSLAIDKGISSRNGKIPFPQMRKRDFSTQFGRSAPSDQPNVYSITTCAFSEEVQLITSEAIASSL